MNVDSCKFALFPALDSAPGLARNDRRGGLGGHRMRGREQREGGHGGSPLRDETRIHTRPTLKTVTKCP